jgi:hypothetical protein
MGSARAWALRHLLRSSSVLLWVAPVVPVQEDRIIAAGQGFAAPSQVRAIRRAPPHHMRQRGGRQVWPRSVPRVGCGGR